MKLTMLNSMAGPDLPVALDRHVAMGLRLVDLKDGLWGQKVEDLNDEQSTQAAVLIRERHLDVHCLSTALGWADANLGEKDWRAGQEQLLQRVLQVAAILRPRYVRVLAVRIGTTELPVRWSYAETVAAHPWLPAAYADLVWRINAAGFASCIENECKHCALATSEDVAAFFAALRPLVREGVCDYVWDVQNMWQMGAFPTLAGYQTLRPFLRLLHLKGGRADARGVLTEASGLRTASWPVLPILEEIRRTGTVSVICLNPSHGKRHADYDVWRVVQDDIAYLRESIPGLESPGACSAG